MPEPATFYGPDGRGYVSVNPSASRAFAVACVEVWAEHEKRPATARHWLLQAKSISVPVEFIGPARARLERRKPDRG